MAGSYQKESVGITNGNGSHDVPETNKPNMKKIALIVGAVALVAWLGFSVSSSGAGGKDDQVAKAVVVDKSGKVRLYDEHDRFVLEDYDVKPTFSSFLPGVAGVYGKPVWSFYVNRGQGIASFGTESKDYPILEFNAANKAYQVTPFVGFRTFVTGTRGSKSFSSEPFSPTTSKVAGASDESSSPKRFMYIGTNDMEIREFDSTNGLETSVQYFVLPEEDFSSQVRRTTFTNTGTSPLTLSALDGLAKMEPDGGKLDGMLKNMGRTLEGWFGVYHADETLTKPYYRLSTEPGDTASVKIEEGGHYCLSFVENGDEVSELLPIVYDTKKVFGQNTPLSGADGLSSSSIADIVAGPQYGDAKTSSAFAAIVDVVLPPGANITVSSFYGKVEHITELSPIIEAITQPGFVHEKHIRARELMTELLAGVETKTSNHLFNAAIKQNFMDNALRGGLPMILGDVDEEMKDKTIDEDERVKVFHVFSRIHGDLERDYNAFKITPSYFSQGPGNYRDVAQNRRNDVFFQPRMASFNVKLFLGYIQADSYEPLTVEAVAYLLTDREAASEVAEIVTADAASKEVLTNILVGGPFRPGQMFELCDQLDVKIGVDDETFINTILSRAEQTPIGVYGTGYWADHWDYYIDLIRSYLAVYPDGEEALMYDQELMYFFSPASVKPRGDKYVLTLTFDGKSKHVLQLDATYWDEDKKDEQESFLNAKTGRIGLNANWQLGPNGKPFKSSPIAKLFLLGSVKYATRDAYGMGVEYEGGRPGWNDAMNGLVGMVGSGMPETFELYQLLKYVQSVVEKYQRPIVIPAELGNMIDKVNAALETLGESGYEDNWGELSHHVPPELFTYWDTVATAREEYRAAIRLQFSGNTTTLPPKEILSMIGNWIDQIDIGIKRAMEIGSRGYDDDGTSGVPPCYFSYDVTDYKLNGKHNDVGLPLVDPKAMKVGQFPLFLEGPVRMMKVIREDKTAVKSIYDSVKTSGLRDDELNMYFLSANLKGQSYDMGRMMAFAPGWLENQSIWMHMSYKYYLELLRAKMYDEFYAEMKGGGMLPFMDADVYGRPLTECSSFIASSAFPDPSEHGRGFLPRLSGSTAEFLSIWVLMFVGPTPFFIDDDGDLKFQLVPALPLWLFEDEEASDLVTADEELSVSFKLFASIVVTYHNTDKTNLYGLAPKKYSVQYVDGSVVDIDGPVVDTETAIDIRRTVKVDSIEVYF